MHTRQNSAAHFYDPNHAQFQDFTPFWEFAAGPLNAGSFCPNLLDDTFGAWVVLQKSPPSANHSPYPGFQFFGQVDIGSDRGNMTLRLVDINGKTVFSKQLGPRLDPAKHPF